MQASFFHLCLALSASFTPPPTGEGLALPPLSVPRFSIAEEPGALPQEKTETSYPRASLGMSCRLILLTTSSHGFNRACLGHRWCRFPTRFPKIAHRATRGRVWFSPPKNKLTPPPKGGGAGYHLGWVRPARSQPGYAGPTGPVWGFAGVVPLPGLQNCTKGHTGASLVFAHSLALLRENIMLLFRTLM